MVSALLRAVIGPEHSRLSLDQSDAKLKPIVTWSPAFSRAFRSLLVFTVSSDWPLSLLWLGFMSVNQKALNDVSKNS